MGRGLRLPDRRTMPQNVCPTPNAGAAEASTAPPSAHAVGRPAGPSPTGRLIGLDLARGLAVFGMYAAHVGPDPARGGLVGHLMELAHGRASALFALLAGVTLVILSGRVPKTGRAARQARTRIVTRAVALLALGTALTMTGTPVEVILAYYGAYFLLALPFARLRAAPLALLAAAWALIGPQIFALAAPHLYDAGWASTVETYDPIARLSGEGVIELLVTGSYPAITWMPFVFAGMAVGRLGLTSRAVQCRLGTLGVALAFLGYGGSWLLIHLIPGAVATIGSDQVWWSDTGGYPPSDAVSAAWLLVASPHSETTLSVIGNTGVAIAVVAGALAGTARSVRLRRVAAPLIAVGTMSLTAYVFHVAGIGLLGIEELPGSPLHVLFAFLGSATVLAVLWTRYFRRGPLEYLLHRATRWGVDPPAALR
jgi:uncharacterized membrane protein YeiB